MSVLAGDIGGTSTRLALFEEGRSALEPSRVEVFASREHASLGDAVQAFVEASDASPRLACFGVPGPVVGGRAKITNLPWTVDASELRERFGFERTWLINDLEAAGWSVDALGDDERTTLREGVPDDHGNAAVLAAGTGLGVALLPHDGRRRVPAPSEGGHVGFAPHDERERDLSVFAAKRFGRVSWERVLSGPGLVVLFDFLRERGDGEPDAALLDQMRRGDAAAAITKAGLEARCPVAERALTLFARLYGRAAGDLALVTLATAGVFIAGGIAPRILDVLRGPEFEEGFLDKGRMRSLVERMPVRVVTNDKAALKGAARCALVRAGVDA
jgi:glucokinase